MKKLIYTSVLTVAMMMVMAGCGNKDDKKDTGTTTNEQTTVSTQDTSTSSEDAKPEIETTDKTTLEIADAIKAEGEFKDDLMSLSTDVALARLYSLDKESIEDAAFYTNSQASAEEIAVIKVKSEDYKAAVKASYEQRVADQKNACQDYLPDEISKLDSAVIYENGNYVILVVSEDNEKAQEIINGLFK